LCVGLGRGDGRWVTTGVGLGAADALGGTLLGRATGAAVGLLPPHAASTAAVAAMINQTGPRTGTGYVAIQPPLSAAATSIGTPKTAVLPRPRSSS
jgi:hypothetical protein